MPFDIIKPVLERATADQLFMLEHYNPYLIEDTDCLWQFHSNREFRNKQREEMETWREMYMVCTFYEIIITIKLYHNFNVLYYDIYIIIT